MTDEDDINVIIDFSHKFSLIRCLGEAMLPVRLKLRADVFASETAQEIDFDITFAKIKFWFETVVSRSIVFTRSNSSALTMLIGEHGKPRVTNHLMLTPFEPTDEHLAVLFQSKMGALSGNTIEFGGVRIEADDAGLVFTYVGDWREDLPTMEEWFNKKPYYFDEPWWRRDDASTLDVIPDDADPTQPPAWAYKLDFIETAIRPKVAEAPEKNGKNGKKDKTRGFRPKVISGGKENK